MKIMEKNENFTGMDMNFFLQDNSNIEIPLDMNIETPKKKRGRPPKTKKLADGTEYVSDEKSERELSMCETNQPYLDSYDETNNMLKGSISQIDVLQGDINVDLQQIRSSKTLKKKYDYIAALTSSVSTLIGTKVTAIREINKSTTDSHNLELKRMKDLKVNEREQDDNKDIMDIYNAFISAPIGNPVNPFGMDTSQLTTPAGLGLNPYDIGTMNQQGALTPQQNMMRLEHNPDIKTVVIYESSTGKRWFDVIDKTTGQSLPNVDKPDSMFLEDTTLDVRNGIARNTNLNTTYDLIVINDSNMMEY